MSPDRIPSRRLLLLGGLGLLAGCSVGPPPPVAQLPSAGGITTDPARTAILHAAYALAHPASLRNNPAEAAQTISELEFLAVELNYGPRWIELRARSGAAMVAARPEWRDAMGIAAAAEPQQVIDAMTAVRYAIGAQNQAAAAAALQAPLITPGGAASFARLSALPALPRSAFAAAQAQQELWQMQMQDDDGGIRIR